MSDFPQNYHDRSQASSGRLQHCDFCKFICWRVEEGRQMMTKCKHLVRDPSWRKPPHCIKLKVDEPESLGLCRRCMFREIEPEPEPAARADQEEREKAVKALEEANAKRKAAWRRYLKFQGPDWRPLLKAAMEAEREYIDLASKYGQMVV